jgi:hypothetical protein
MPADKSARRDVWSSEGNKGRFYRQVSDVAISLDKKHTAEAWFSLNSVYSFSGVLIICSVTCINARGKF